MTFGGYVHHLRADRKKTLRQFCLENGLNLSFWSKVERDVNPPPQDTKSLGQWAGYFGIGESSEHWELLIREAENFWKSKLTDGLKEKNIFSLLPPFIRCGRDCEIKGPDIQKLAQKIKTAYLPGE